MVDIDGTGVLLDSRGNRAQRTTQCSRQLYILHGFDLVLHLGHSIRRVFLSSTLGYAVSAFLSSTAMLRCKAHDQPSYSTILTLFLSCIAAIRPERGVGFHFPCSVCVDPPTCLPARHTRMLLLQRLKTKHSTAGYFVNKTLGHTMLPLLIPSKGHQRIPRMRTGWRW